MLIDFTEAELNTLAIILSDVSNGDLSGSEDLRYNMPRVHRLSELLYRAGVDPELMFERCGDFILPWRHDWRPPNDQQPTGRRLVPEEVANALRYVRSFFPDVVRVTFDSDQRRDFWRYETADGVAPSFASLCLDTYILELALDAAWEDRAFPATYTIEELSQ